MQAADGRSRPEVETGSTLAAAFRKYPQYFDALFCNLVAAGEQAGILETLLDRLATYKEKTLAIKSKIKSALFYPVAIIVVALRHHRGHHDLRDPGVQAACSASFGADLPAPTLVVMAISDDFVAYWYLIFGSPGRRHATVSWTLWKKSLAGADLSWTGSMLKAPVFGDLVEKVHRRALDAHRCRPCSPPACRWWRRSTRSAAPRATRSTCSPPSRSSSEVSTRAPALTRGDAATPSVFPNMVLQMVPIGEESGSLDSMLGKVADFSRGRGRRCRSTALSSA
jgi:type IV pilus assembly protein PilC